MTTKAIINVVSDFRMTDLVGRFNYFIQIVSDYGNFGIFWRNEFVFN